jgi:NADH-quinone oxidoreductase subunit C
MSLKLDNLKAALEAKLGDRLAKLIVDQEQIIGEVSASHLLDVLRMLRDDPAFAFGQLIDLCGMDYTEFGGNWDGQRYAVVYQLLSLSNNQRLRVRTWCADDDFPLVASAIDVWASANWYEREAFDLYGIVFDGHPDLRRILTDYGFVGHPFRKDFPVFGNVEMRYDAELKRVIYQPVSIEPREIVPKVIREDHYAGRK